jgi:hypothetical protein
MTSTTVAKGGHTLRKRSRVDYTHHDEEEFSEEFSAPKRRRSNASQTAMKGGLPLAGVKGKILQVDNQ